MLYLAAKLLSTAEMRRYVTSSLSSSHFLVILRQQNVEDVVCFECFSGKNLYGISTSMQHKQSTEGRRHNVCLTNPQTQILWRSQSLSRHFRLTLHLLLPCNQEKRANVYCSKRWNDLQTYFSVVCFSSHFIVVIKFCCVEAHTHTAWHVIRIGPFRMSTNLINYDLFTMLLVKSNWMSISISAFISLSLQRQTVQLRLVSIF